MAKQLNVNLALTADTSKAKAQLQDLQQQLSKVMSVVNNQSDKFAMTSDIKEATLAAAQLKVQLEGATNVNTGKLDLTKFSKSLKDSNMTLKDYRNILSSLGPEGDKAFSTLARSVMTAEIPLRRTNKLVDELWTSLKNTARWQLSSSALHGFMGAIQGAYGYAQDLNKSLTDIRIVTGFSADKMGEFADQANKAAKRLSTTTTEYTNAALIYYQQGLKEQEVLDRTDITVKMANVTGQSAQVVSDQLTAIWNNFNKSGDVALEHYANVLTALGAKTASSSDEIAGGLEKFAAVADTIGLSYEYAASALATITAETRQSEDVVGTALKTIFARIQGLSLGETLEDGTDLNKYSKALMSVGISIKDQNGELKAMDTILDEMGSKWNTLSKDQQVALAQTVAGVRQYNQLVSLMDSYDTFQGNVDTANNSDGALNLQADKYAQGWEGARNRVKSAAEDIYDSLINDDFFIDLNDGFAKFLTGLGEVIDGMGGLKGVLLSVGAIALNVFKDKIGRSLSEVGDTIKSLTPSGKQDIENRRKEANDALIHGAVDIDTSSGAAMADAYADMGKLQQAYLDNVHKMNDGQKRTSELLLDQQQILMENVSLAGQQVDKAQEQYDITARDTSKNYTTTSGKGKNKTTKTHVISPEQKKNIQETEKAYMKITAEITKYEKILSKVSKVKIDAKNIKEVRENFKGLTKTVKETGLDIEKCFGKEAKKAFDNLADIIEGDVEVSVEELQNKFDALFSSIDSTGAGTDELNALKQALVETGMPLEEVNRRMEACRVSAENLGTAEANLSQKSSMLSSFTQQVSTRMEELNNKMSLGQTLLSCASAIGTVVSAGNAMHSMFQTLNNEDLSFGEKLSAVFSTLAIIVPTVTTFLKSDTAATLANALAKSGLGKALTAMIPAIGANAAAWYAHPIMWIAAIIVGVIALIGLLIGWLMKSSEAAKANAENAAKLAEESEKLAEADRERRAEIEEMVSAYEELTAQYENNEISLQDLRTSTYELLKSYGLQSEAVRALMGDYEELDQIMEDAKRKANDDVIKSSSESMENQINAMVKDMIAIGGSEIDNNGTTIDLLGTNGVNSAGQNALIDELEALGIDTGDGTGHIDLSDFAEEAITNNAELKRVLGQYLDEDYEHYDADAAETASQLLGYIEDNQQFADNYNTSQASFNEASLDNIGLDHYTRGTAESQEQLQGIIEDMTDAALEQNLFTGEDAEEQARLWAENYISSADEEAAQILMHGNMQEALSKKMSGTEEEIAAFLDEVAQSENGLLLLSGIEVDRGATVEEVRNALALAQAEVDATGIETRLEVTNAAKEEITGDGLTEETRASLEQEYGDAVNWEDFDNSSRVEQLETINALTEQEIENNIRLAESLTQVRDDMAAQQTEDEARKQEIQNQMETIAQQIVDMEEQWEDADLWTRGGLAIGLGQAKINLELLEHELEELNAKDYTVDVNIEETLLDNFELKVEGIISQADLLKQAAETIGEGFIVAAEDARLLADTYPEIMRNAEVLADGRIQLDQQACEAIMGNNAAILGSDTDTTAGQLKNKIALLDAQIAYEKQKAQLIQDYLNGVIDGAELEEGIEKATAQFEQDLRQAGLEDEANAIQTAYENQVASTDGALELLNTIDKKIEDISINYANMLSGEKVTAVDAVVPGGGIALSSEYTQTNIGDIDNTADEDYAKWQEEYNAVIENIERLEGTRGDYTALLSELLANSSAAVESAESAAKGLGGDLSDKDSGKEKEKDIKKLDDEIDRYHAIKELLEDIGVELNRIQKKKDRAWGGGKLAAINEETAALKQQLSALKQYQSQIESNLSKDKGALGQYGWSLDGNGNVSNYEANMARLVNQWNNSAQEDADKEYFENAKKALQQYEESKDLYDDVIDQITDATYALADAELEAIEYSVEIYLELDDNKLKLLEDIMETIGDSAARAVDNIEMIEKSIDTVLHQMETSKDGMKSIFDYIGLSGDVANRIMNGTASEGDQKSLAEILNSYGGAIDMDRVVQDLQQYQDNLLSYNEALRNYRDQVFETVNNAFTEHLEDFDRANDKIAHCVNLVSGYKDLIEAIGRKNIDVHGELTQKLNQALEAQAEDAHRAALAKEKYAQSAYQEALEGYQTAIETGDEYAINKWTEILETAQDELQAAKEDSQSALTEWANAIAESFSSAIQQVIDDLDTALGGLKLLREDFDMAQEIDAQYLDDYEKIYQLSKLTREVQASMDETDNVAAKKALMEYQSKINAYQQQGVQMSQYELDYLRAQYELELARIALEESQNAKSQVSMVKDAEGNYSYVYTADDEAVAEAEQTYEDRLYEMQRLNGDYINELQSNIITMQEEMSAKLQEIAEDDMLSYEEKMIRMEEVRNYYLERIHFYDSQLGISIENNKNLYEGEWTDYHNKTGYKISANEDYIDSWDETTLAILSNVETQEGYLEQIKNAIDLATEKAELCCERAKIALNEASMTTEELGKTVSLTTDELVRDADEAARSAEQMSQEYQWAMQEIMNAATSFTSAYAAMITNTINQNQSLISSMQEVINMAIQMKSTLASASAGVSTGPGSSSGGGQSPGGGGGNGSTKSEAKSIIQGVHTGKIGGGGAWQGAARAQGYSSSAISMALKALNDSKAGGGYSYDYAKALALVDSYDTGGYTGNWGTSQGRLALLHQKELVLNAQDTPNILDAVGIVRDIAKAIDINALSAMVNGGLTAATFSNGKEEVLEQNVHITAEFPNATDKHEILEAFDNVINLAAQYANRKN